jgi:8-oxo-dGTP pyrophosphatase MutT (NUDIX family)
VARELFEEAGLVAKSFERKVGRDYVFPVRRLRIEKFTFIVEVERMDVVRLDPNEHQNYLWATEEECRRMGLGDLPKRAVKAGSEGEFTFPKQKEIVLEGFKVRKEMKERKASA